MVLVIGCILVEVMKMSKYSVAVNKSYRMPIFKTFFNLFTIIFLCLSLWSLWSSISEKKEWDDAKKNGVRVEATIVDVISELESPDDANHAFFEYTYNNKKFTYEYEHYPDGLTIGKQVTAYVYPDNPKELIISTSSTNLFFFWFMLGLAAISTTPGWIMIYRKSNKGD